MLTGIHFLLTYNCNFECDHCFLYCGPKSTGTFKISQLREVFAQIAEIETIKWVYFEGGEPFLFYPLMLEGIRIAHEMGLKTGIVTNAYWALTAEDAGLWLQSLLNLELSDLSISDDAFHYSDEKNSLAKNAISAAQNMGMPFTSLCTEHPSADLEPDKSKGEPVAGKGALLKGRAAEKLTEGLPMTGCDKFIECPKEELRNPKRVHIDPYGNVHLCQGLIMGNIWKTPLGRLFETYDPDSHPICGPLLEGGPALLAKKYDLKHNDKYISACHFCYLMRLALLDRFPEYLAPKQVYGKE